MSVAIVIGHPLLEMELCTLIQAGRGLFGYSPSLKKCPQYCIDVAEFLQARFATVNDTAKTVEWGTFCHDITPCVVVQIKKEAA
jgi:hypothetical protein